MASKLAISLGLLGLLAPGAWADSGYLESSQSEPIPLAECDARACDGLDRELGCLSDECCRY